MQKYGDYSEYAVSRTASVEYLLKPYERWMADKAITEICVNRPQEVFVESANGWERHDCEGATFEALSSLAVAIAKQTYGQDITDSNPILSGILPRGERIQVVMPPACEPGAISITIRKPSFVRRTIQDYVDSGFFKHVKPASHEFTAEERMLMGLKEAGDYAGFLAKAVSLKKNIVVAGATGSGKTTFMKALVENVATTDRIITIEDVQELFLPNHPNHVHLFYPAGAKDDDAVTATSLLKSCLRMKPSRILLAELRGGETYDFINITASGHEGSITSCHADSGPLTFERMAFMMQQNRQGRELPYGVIRRLLYQLVDVVVHIHNDIEGGLGRHITEVWYDPARKRLAASASQEAQ